MTITRKRSAKMQQCSETMPATNQSITLNKDRFLQLLNEAAASRSLAALKKKTAAIKHRLTSAASKDDLFDASANGNAIALRKDVLAAELDQILEARTLERARYYLKRLTRGVSHERIGTTNDINLLRWKEEADILTDSLWVLPRRDTTGAHLGWYWGNFIPQIPHQLLRRYTKKNDWVLDTFLGSGTTLIECRRLGRNGIGIELNPAVAERALSLIEQEHNPQAVRTEIINGDARTVNLRDAFGNVGINQAQLLIMHPPYHDIITFSENERDLSTATSIQAFLQMFGEAVDNATPLLERGRYFALVIGDKYAKGEWVPLGFECMNEVLKRGYSLKSIVVKNFEETRAKRDQKQLWRYRALVGGFYIFKHEYIFLFRKK